MVSVKGAIITVKFEITDPVLTLPNVTVPLFGPEYIRYPIQPGDKGVVFSCDAYIGGMSGLGGGVASLTQPTNLSALVFFPIGNTQWVTVDPQAVVIYGPNGVVLRDAQSQVTFTLTPTAIVIKGNVTIQGNLAVQGSLSATGTIVGGQGTADQISLQTHRHGTTGNTASATVPPTAGT